MLFKKKNCGRLSILKYLLELCVVKKPYTNTKIQKEQSHLL